MANLPYIAAVDEGIHQEMRRDPNVLYFGQNLATTENHAFVAAYGHDRVRVTPELVQVSNNASKWSVPFDTVMSDVFAVQSAIASHVAENLNVALAPPTKQRLASRPPQLRSATQRPVSHPPRLQPATQRPASRPPRLPPATQCLASRLRSRRDDPFLLWGR